MQLTLKIWRQKKRIGQRWFCNLSSKGRFQRHVLFGDVGCAE